MLVVCVLGCRYILTKSIKKHTKYQGPKKKKSYKIAAKSSKNFLCVFFLGKGCLEVNSDGIPRRVEFSNKKKKNNTKFINVI